MITKLHIGNSFFIRSTDFSYGSTEFADFADTYPMINNCVSAITSAVNPLVADTLKIMDSNGNVTEKRVFLSLGFGSGKLEVSEDGMYAAGFLDAESEGKYNIGVVDFSTLIPYQASDNTSIAPMDNAMIQFVYDSLNDRSATLLGENGESGRDDPYMDMTTMSEPYYWYTLVHEGFVSFPTTPADGRFAQADEIFDGSSANAFVCKTYRLVVSDLPLTEKVLGDFIETYA